MLRGNPMPGFPQIHSAPAETGLTRTGSPSHEYSRPRGPQR
jgi:hypothetical protein